MRCIPPKERTLRASLQERKIVAFANVLRRSVAFRGGAIVTRDCACLFWKVEGIMRKETGRLYTRIERFIYLKGFTIK